ncbi:MAG: IS1380 family transposase, partial [Planctomycetota bacterium]
MDTHCTPDRFEFQGPGRRILTAAFDGGQITSDGGVLLLREIDRRRRIIERLAKCMIDLNRIAIDPEAVEAFFVDVFLDSFDTPPEEIILDIDATDNPLHGSQEGRFFHGYYDCFCYLPLYVFCGKHVLVAKLRRSNIDASAGSVEVLEELVRLIRERWSEVRILVRGDSAFARDALMSWCEDHDVDYVFGLARNPRLVALLEPAMEETERLCAESGEPERVYAELRYQTLDSWRSERRVIGKAEITRKGENPRFVVTSLEAKDFEARLVYEEIYCARGESENRIKEQQLDLFATRTSGHLMRVNQVRLWFSAVAYT